MFPERWTETTCGIGTCRLRESGPSHSAFRLQSKEAMYSHEETRSLCHSDFVLFCIFFSPVFFYIFFRTFTFSMFWPEHWQSRSYLEFFFCNSIGHQGCVVSPRQFISQISQLKLRLCNTCPLGDQGMLFAPPSFAFEEQGSKLQDVARSCYKSHLQQASSWATASKKPSLSLSWS